METTLIRDDGTMEAVQPYWWVKKTYIGKMADSIESLAHYGLGYIIIDKPDNKSVTVAFKATKEGIGEPLSEWESENMETLISNRNH
jgi:hypothetical protein